MVESFKPEVGFEIQFDVPHNDKIYQHLWKVTDVVRVRKNAYSWKYGGHSGDSVVRASSCSTKGERPACARYSPDSPGPGDVRTGDEIQTSLPVISSRTDGLDRLAKGFFGIRLTWNYRENYE